MKSKSHLIAELLIDATENVLMKDFEDWMNEKHPNKKLTYKIGSGKKTYHRKLSETKSVIVYGKKMIESKLISYRNCAMWLTGKEILARNYFNSELTIQTSLCSVIVHEVAHYFQVIAGHRDYGSVHNEHFYRILDKMHASGASQKVYDYLNQHQLFRELDFEQKDESSSDIAIPVFSKSDFKIGYVFYFKDSSGNEIVEIVRKVNSKRLQGVHYSVPYPMITKVETDSSKVNPELLPKLPKFNNKNIKKGDVISFKSSNGRILEDTVIKANPKKVLCLRYTVPYSIITEVK
jgi:hypothetical protein